MPLPTGIYLFFHSALLVGIGFLEFPVSPLQLLPSDQFIFPDLAA